MEMGVDFSTSIYLPNFDVWARSVTISPRRPGIGV